jgi:hypothetical protein
MKEYINTDLKNYDQIKKLLNLRNFFIFLIIFFNIFHLHKSTFFLLSIDLRISDVIINQNTFFEFNTYLITEHSILRNMDYRKTFDYIEELINRNVCPNFFILF